MKLRSTQLPRVLIFLFLTTSSDCFAQRWMPRISFQKALAITLEEDTRFTNYQASVGYVSPSVLVPSFAVYATYDKYNFDHDWISTRINQISSTGIFPAIKLARIFLIGYGYSFGSQMQMQSYYGDTTAYFNGKYSHWGSFLAVDIDIYIYEEFYFTFGYYNKAPISYLSWGLSKRF